MEEADSEPAGQNHSPAAIEAKEVVLDLDSDAVGQETQRMQPEPGKDVAICGRVASDEEMNQSRALDGSWIRSRHRRHLGQAIQRQAKRVACLRG